MNWHVITLFPEMFDSYMNESLMARAKEKKLMKVNFLNPRDFHQRQTSKS
jgi:tRNA (guanine37-N1)-methyltransferase